MNIVKYIGKSIPPELSELVEEVLKHEQRREGESDRDYYNRYWSEAPRRTYEQMPEEMKAWIDAYLPVESLKDFFLLMVSPDAGDMKKRLEDPEELARTLGELRQHLTYAVRLYRIHHTENMDDMEIGLYADVTGADMLAAWAATKAAGVLQEAAAPQDPAAAFRVKAIRKGDPLENIIYPLDKINSYVWSFPGEMPPGLLPYKSEGRNSKKEVSILCGIEFNDFTQADGTAIAKTLSDYDKSVYTAIASLFDAGHELVSLQQIHEAMGSDQRASVNQRAKISYAVEKMSNIRITIDNTQEIAAGFKYPREQYTGPLLSVESHRIFAQDGSLKTEQFHILSEPRLLSFAKLRKQVVAIPVKVLTNSLSKTEGNLAIQHYLLERIAHMGTGRGQSKILYETICKHAHVTSVRERNRLPKKVKDYLDHYVACKFIASYNASKDGVSISVKDDRQQGSEKRDKLS